MFFSRDSGPLRSACSTSQMMPCYAYDSIEQHHTLEGHPEHRGRLSTTLHLLQEDGILNRFAPIPATPVSEEELLAVHTSAYVRRVERAAASGLTYLDPDTYVVSGSYEAALASAGALVNVAGAVMRGESSSGMSLMRPPGHHALPDRGHGLLPVRQRRHRRSRRPAPFRRRTGADRGLGRSPWQWH